MLSDLFGLRNREQVLQFILASTQGNAKEIADFYKRRSVHEHRLTSGAGMGLQSHENHGGRTSVLFDGTKIPAPEMRWLVCWAGSLNTRQQTTKIKFTVLHTLQDTPHF